MDLTNCKNGTILIGTKNREITIMQDPEQVRSFYCGECGAEGDVEYDLGDGYEIKFCPFCGSDLEIEDEFDIQEELDFDE